MKYKKIYIAFNSIDANLMRSTLSSENILTLTPNAFHSLKNTDNNIIRSNEIFDNNKHKIVAEKVLNDEQKISQLIENEKSLSSIAKEIYINHIHAGLCICHRTLLSIPESDSYVLYFENELIEKNDKYGMYTILLQRFNEDSLVYIDNKKPFFTPLIKLINYISSKFLSRRTTHIFTSFDYGFRWMSNEIIKNNKNTVFIGYVYTKGNLSNLLKSLRTLFSILTGDKIVKFVIPTDTSNFLKYYDDFLKKIKDKNIRDGLEIFLDHIGKRAELSNYLSLEIEKLLEVLKPKNMIAHQMRSPMALAIANACNMKKIPVYLASHGTHLLSKKEVANFEQKSLARGLLASPIVKYNVVQSEMAKEAMKSYFPDLKYLFHEQINWGFPCLLENKRKSKKIRFLHASTYKAAITFRPWIFETSDEFHKSLIELIDVFQKIESVELVIRHREIGEMSTETYEENIINLENIIIKTDQDCPFLEDLECADVVIANFSTTIEEAVSMEKYVILWGEGSRYSHIDNQYLNNELVYPVYSSEELYNTIKLLVQKLSKKQKKAYMNENPLKESQKRFIKHILS